MFEFVVIKATSAFPPLFCNDDGDDPIKVFVPDPVLIYTFDVPENACAHVRYP